ncbi:hypothetical protein WR25_24131 [Diploscapter pachys]|uniref:N-acetylgalactosaminide beta-1,3-galactosyltransferase n=1 Tax=Diploscapter pachys TaxID=2018661 RepID=A0A2A2K1S8_9BILA|nr:hypothetical protein WR25_24131 [Diploscapter pachys]
MAPLLRGHLWLYKAKPDDSELEFDRPYSSRWNLRNIKSCLVILILFLAALLIVVQTLYFWNRHVYDRKFDSQLHKYIVSSPAAKALPRKGQLFCWVQTSPIYHDSRVMAINETWLHRCDHGQLFTSAALQDDKIPYSTVFAGIPDSYYNLFYKSRFAFHYIYRNISSEFDWYYKVSATKQVIPRLQCIPLQADDDTYVIVEHLRAYLSKLNPDEPHYLGYVLKPYLKNGYNAGGSGYVLSNAALKLFDSLLYNNETLCPDNIYEDVGIGTCLASIGIFPEDTRNAKGQNRFNTHSPSEIFHQSTNVSWKFYPEKPGFDAFAPEMISFHHLSPDEIRLFDLLLYRINKNGLQL